MRWFAAHASGCCISAGFSIFRQIGCLTRGGIILQSCRCDGDAMRCIQNAMGKGDRGIKPVPRQPDITILAIHPVDLHPVNKAVTRPAINIGKHCLPSAKRPASAQFQAADCPFDSRALAAVQLIGIIIKMFDKPIDQPRQRHGKRCQRTAKITRRSDHIIRGGIQFALKIIKAIRIANPKIKRSAKMHEKSFTTAKRLR